MRFTALEARALRGLGVELATADGKNNLHRDFVKHVSEAYQALRAHHNLFFALVQPLSVSGQVVVGSR